MGYSAMVEAIKTKIDAVLTAYSVEHDNEIGFSKPDNTVWARAVVRPAPAVTVCIGAQKTYRQTGILDVQVFGPLGSDESAVNNAVEIVIKGFDYVNINVGDAEGTIVKFDFAPYPTVIGRNGGEYQVNVTCPFRADFTSS